MPDGAQISGETAVPDAPRIARRLGTPSQVGRSIAPPDYEPIVREAVTEGMIWLLPWALHNYPGIRKGIVETLGNRVTWWGVRGWRKTGRWPVWAALVVREAIASRVARGQSIVAGIDAYIASAQDKPRRNIGFCKVGEDGKDRRGNWRR